MVTLESGSKLYALHGNVGTTREQVVRKPL